MDRLREVAGFLVETVLLPGVLFFCSFLRPSVLSFVYLVFLFFIPWKCGKWPIKLLLFLSIINFLIIIGFQIFLAFVGPQFGPPDLLELIGLVNLQNLPILQILRWTLPDIIVIMSTSITLLFYKDSSLKIDLIYVLLLASCLVSSINPSLLSLVYFLVFLLGASLWSLRVDLKKFFSVFSILLVMYCFAHNLVLYCWQLRYLRVQFGSLLSEQWMRLLGIVDFVSYSDSDPRSMQILDVLSPLCLQLLYQVVVHEVRFLLGKESPSETKHKISRSSFSSGLTRKYTLRRINQRRRDALFVAINAGESDSLTSEGGTISPPQGQSEDHTTTNLTQLLSIFTKSSYILTNILMMTWSITYHSWLTFVLLLWACVLWIVPNQRNAMLLSSPLLVLYSELLLLIQYAYSLDYPMPMNFFGLKLDEVIGKESGQRFAIIGKSMYTLMFWVTLRQLVGRNREVAQYEQRHSHRESPLFAKIRSILTLTWIWVVALMLFVIGLGGDEKVVLYRIVYMALFLVFVISFQISLPCWKSFLYPFLLTLIIYSMLVLVMIYTYQFEDVPEYLTNYTGIPLQLQKDIGLEKFDTGSLFVRLLTPTFFLVITVIQLHYFHGEFIKERVQQSINASSCIIEIEDENYPSVFEEFTWKNVNDNVKFYWKKFSKEIVKFYKISSRIFIGLMRIHISKIVVICCFLVSVSDKSVLHFLLLVLLVVGTVDSLQIVIIHIISAYISLLLLVKMIYQIDYIDHSNWERNCTETIMGNDAEWLGFKKVDSSLTKLLAGYIGLLLLLTLRSVLTREKKNNFLIFEGIGRNNADESIKNMIKFLVNFGFYKFGVEISLVWIVLVIGTRLDIISVLYSLWLFAMFQRKRVELERIWKWLISFVGMLVPLQYLAAVGVPVGVCWEYLWSDWNSELKSWLFLPDYEAQPDVKRIIPDFILLLLITCQKFTDQEAGGENNEILENTIAIIPTPDFMIHTDTNEKDRWLKIVKRILYLSLYWISLAIVFLTGTNRVNLFALGYLVGSFVFLWEGNEFYLRQKTEILKRWNVLLAYNVVVITAKSFLQLIGCVFMKNLQYKFCWFVQLFGIACLNMFRKLQKDELACEVPNDEAGLAWDGITFAFLLIQRRIFYSYDFFHIRSETEVQAKLASRGAELINDLMMKEIGEQEEEEKRVLEKIKMKMDRIKATHEKQNENNKKVDHFDAIRSGDYYMFDGDQDEEDVDDQLDKFEDLQMIDDDPSTANKHVTISELMSSALKTGDLDSAVNEVYTRKYSWVSKTGEPEKFMIKNEYLLRLIGYIRFTWAMIESLLVSMTNWMNKFSKDYRHVACILAKEKRVLKGIVDLPPQPEPMETGSSSSSSVVGSKDDLQTVIERRSSQGDNEDLESEHVQSDLKILVELCLSIWYVLISHSDMVCYVLVFINQVKSSSLLSLPLPLMVLLWGSLSVPRPTKTFWVTMIAYTEAMVVLKYMFQFDFFPWNGKGSQLKVKDPFWPPKILGIEKHEKYAVYDVILLMSVFFHRFMLKSLGLWKNSSNAGSNERIIEADEEEKKIVWEEWNKIMRPGVLKICVVKYMSSIREFFGKILRIEYKVKVDVYSYMFMCDFFNFLVVIFGFASFGSQQGDVSSYLEENKVPVPFLVMVILQFALIVIDRALYLRKDIMGKFFFQIFLVTFVHIAMFFLLPWVTERDFNQNTPPPMWYLVKCVYLLLSAYQIRSGYPTRILGNFLCKKYNYLNMFLFKGFMAVPFLFELRALMDWIWTDTSMTLSDWLKLEDIFAHCFQLKCQRRVEKEYPQTRGMAKQGWSKYTIGGGSLFLIIAIIWFPLVLFALGNTVGITNQPSEIEIQISLAGAKPIYTMQANKNSLKMLTQQDWSSLEYVYRRDKTGQNFLSSYEFDDLFVAKLDGNSSSVWGISPPSRDSLVKELQSNNTISLRLSWKVSRDTSNPTVEPVAIGKGDEVELDLESRKTLVKMIKGATDEQVEIKGIFPKFLRISNSGKAEVANQLSQGLIEDRNWFFNLRKTPDGKEEPNAVLRNVTLKLERQNEEEWWVVQEVCKRPPEKPLPFDTTCNLNLYSFNEKAFPPTLSFISGGGIIGLYTTLVLVASKFVRGFFSGISFLIMFDDMPNVDRVFQLCLDIYLVRESGELCLEEDLFAKLIFLYRSPETLIKWTRPKKEDLPPNN